MRSVVVLALLAGCGDNNDLDRCLPDGFADGESMVAGAPLGPFVRAGQLATSSRRFALTHAFVLDETPGACGTAPAEGRRLVIAFCEQPTETDYAIVPESLFSCGAGEALAVVEEANGTDVVKANAGTVAITSAGVCIAGTYALTFGGDMLEGSFDVAVCP
ncbi:MAG: hypothetical protein SFX73_39670 [Kofleriaceae bacterium]|nr:hypothetical protein [Kofleriaceae bacterium]